MPFGVIEAAMIQNTVQGTPGINRNLGYIGKADPVGPSSSFRVFSSRDSNFLSLKTIILPFCCNLANPPPVFMLTSKDFHQSNSLVMKKISLAVSFCLTMILTLPAVAQSWWGGIKGEGPKVVRELNLDKFDGFTLSISGTVYVRQGSPQSVEIEAQDNIIANIKTDVSGNIWKIGFDKNVRDHDGVKIWITVPTLTRAGISGSGDIVGESRFTGLGDLDLGISGSGNIRLEFEAKNVSSGISGSGDMDLRGRADSHQVRISGSGDIKAYDLETGASEIRISGSGGCQVNASEDLNISTSGSGDVYYRGRPRVKAKVSGSGEVVPKN